MGSAKEMFLGVRSLGFALDTGAWAQEIKAASSRRTPKASLRARIGIMHAAVSIVHRLNPQLNISLNFHPAFNITFN
jgi:hypothetical protein